MRSADFATLLLLDGIVNQYVEFAEDYPRPTTRSLWAG
jgi:hypothetical protein